MMVVVVVVVVVEDTRNYKYNSLCLCIATHINLDRSNTVFFHFKVNKCINYKKAKHDNISLRTTLTLLTNCI